uniref:Uncharacterized protein n=1 Tax=Anguilla anguilla TaxID=7936 RepID=A0A0E9R875_ANGAN
MGGHSGIVVSTVTSQQKDCGFGMGAFLCGVCMFSPWVYSGYSSFLPHSKTCMLGALLQVPMTKALSSALELVSRRSTREAAAHCS